MIVNTPPFRNVNPYPNATLEIFNPINEDIANPTYFVRTGNFSLNAVNLLVMFANPRVKIVKLGKRSVPMEIPTLSTADFSSLKDPTVVFF